MNKIIAFLQLIRWQNLLITAAIFYFTRHFIIEPLYALENHKLTIDHLNFFFFALGYLTIIAGGYAINDYYDIGIDEINRPEKVILRKHLPLSAGKNIYFILTLIGFLISAIVIINLEIHKLLFVLIIITFLFWFYSTKYKRELLSGNLTIAILGALSIGIVWLYEFFASIQHLNFPIFQAKTITNIIIIYATFAFLLTFIREIIKDIVDMKGDAEFQCHTLPIRYGISKTKKIIYLIYATCIAFSAFVCYILWKKEFILLFYYAILLNLFLLYILYLIIKAKNIDDFRNVSNFLKVMFIAGILSMQLFYLQTTI